LVLDGCLFAACHFWLAKHRWIDDSSPIVWQTPCMQCHILTCVALS
jgi:hypothetical protein